MKEKIFGMTDEQGRLKMLPVRARATQHNTTKNPAHLPMRTLSCLKSNLLFLPPPHPPPAKPMVPPRRTLPQTDTNIHTAQLLVGHPRSTPNTLSISATQRGTPGDLLAQQHAPPHMVSSVPACSPVPLAAASTTAIGRIVAPLPRYATSYNHVETWRVGFMDIESESEAQSLSALSPPIRRHQAQSHSLGTVNTHNQVDVGQGGGTQVRYQQLVLPVYSECSSVYDSMHVPMSTQHHQPNVAPTPLSPASYTHVETLQSRYYDLGVQQQVQPAVRQAQLQQTQGFQGSVTYGVPPAEAASSNRLSCSDTPAIRTKAIRIPHAHAHVDASIYAQMPIEPQYAPQYAQESYISTHHHPYV